MWPSPEACASKTNASPSSAGLVLGQLHGLCAAATHGHKGRWGLDSCSLSQQPRALWTTTLPCALDPTGRYPATKPTKPSRLVDRGPRVSLAFWVGGRMRRGPCDLLSTSSMARLWASRQCNGLYERNEIRPANLTPLLQHTKSVCTPRSGNLALLLHDIHKLLTSGRIHKCFIYL